MTPDLIAFPLILLMPLALAGLAILNAGLTRSRSTAHLLLASLVAAAVAMLVYLVIGFSLAGYGAQGHVIQAGGKAWGFLGNGRLFARSVKFDESTGPLVLLWQLFAVAMAAAIPVASGAERWRIAAVAASSALLGAITFPLMTHWVSQQGWLGQTGFSDGGGAATVQCLGGLQALCIAWILGARQNKFTAEGIPTAMPGHSAVLVLFGGVLTLVGWFGLTVAGAALAGKSAGTLILVAVNTVLAAAAGAVASLTATRFRFGKPDASLTANGWVAGLVSISACATNIKPAAAILAGLVAGVIVVFAIEVIEVRMRVDDPAGAISVHAGAGLWSLFVACMFGDATFLAQALGVASLLGVLFPLTYGLNALLNRFLPQRVEPGGERQGMDLFELGAGAYPEFMTHREDFLRR